MSGERAKDQIASPVPDPAGRRLEDREWRAEVAAKFEKLESGLASNTLLTEATIVLTKQLSRNLELHREQTAPVIEAVQTMQSGVRFLGKLGAVLGWCAGKVRYWAPTIGVGVAFWLAFREELRPWIVSLMWWRR